MDIEVAAEQITGHCACHESYTSRRMVDPNCRFHDFHADIVDALRKAQDEAFEMAAGISDRRMRLWFGNIRIEKPYEHLTVREQFEVVSDAIRSLKSKGETK